MPAQQAHRGAPSPAPRRHAEQSGESQIASLPMHRISCAHCASVRTTTISMTLTDGSAVEFTSCRACEGKTWTGADGRIALDGVLARATRVRA